MSPPDGYIFVSHVEEDADVALELALRLELAGFRTWTYEADTAPGGSYLLQMGQAVEECRAVLVLISPTALASPHIRKELIRGHESDKEFLPVLRGITDAEYKARRPEWREVIGSATSVEYDPEDVDGVVEALVRGLAFLGVSPHGAAPTRRLEELRKHLKRAHSSGVPAPAEPTVPTAAVEAGAVRPPERSPPPRSRWRVVWLVAAGLAGVLVGVLAVVLRPQPEGPITVGVMDIHPQGNVAGWVAEFTRDGLNSVLTEFPPERVRVYSKQKIDFLREKRKLSEIEAAESLQIGKMISGTISATQATFVLRLQVVDMARNGLLEGSTEVRGSEIQLVDMQNNAAFQVLRLLKVPFGDDDVRRISRTRTSDLLDEYKLLAESMGGLQGAAAPAPRSGDPAPEPGTWLGPPAAHAAESADEAAVRQLLEHYRTALEAKDLEQIGTVYLTVTGPMRDALGRYFESARDLQVQFSDFDILVEGDEALATFTRVDTFKDAETGRDVRLQVRVNSVVAKQPEGWKIKVLKRPS